SPESIRRDVSQLKLTSRADRPGRRRRPLSARRLVRTGAGTNALEPPTSSKLRDVAEGKRGAEDVAAVLGEQANQLVHRWHDRVGRRLGACDGNTEADEQLFDPGGAEGDEHACAV